MSGWDGWFIGIVIGALTAYEVVTLLLGLPPHDLLAARRLGRDANRSETDLTRHSGGVP